MLDNNEVLRRAIVRSCKGASDIFTESVASAYSALFEDGEVAGQENQQDQTVPVNAQNVVNSDAANTIPAQLKDAQTTAQAVETEKQKLDALQKTASEKVENLKDTLAVASADTQQENPNGQA